MVYVIRIFLTVITVSLLLSVPAQAQLDEHCTISILNRTARVKADGTWKLPNVPATNQGVRVRARATCTENGVTRSGQSSYVLLTPNRTFAFDSDITLTTPEPIPASLTLTAPLATLPTVGATTQLTVTARFPDGSTREVTAGASGTNYTISNRAVATVSPDGLVTAVGGGTVIISALNEGALGLMRLQVAVTGGDTDGDGIPDDVEIANGLNPNDPTDGTQDADGDGLTNKQELVDYSTNPRVADTDGDGVRDGLEIQTGSNPLDPGSRNLAQALTAIAITPTTSLLIRNTIVGSATRQLTVSGQLRDGNTIDLTATASGTMYMSSDPAVCDLVGGGRVLAGESAGLCTVTATNNGFTASASVEVELFAPTALSSIAIPGYANNVDVSEGYAYVAAGAAGLQVVDVSDPSTPVIVGALDTPGNANDVRVVATLAYVADGVAGLQIIDISTPTNPVLRGTFDTPGEAMDVRVLGTRAYIADGEAGVQILEVSTPAAPALVGAVDTPGIARGVDVSGSVAVVADDGSAGSTPSIRTVDITTPGSPNLLGSVDAPSLLFGASQVMDVIVRGTLAYVAGDRGSGFAIVDTSVPTAPRYVSSDLFVFFAPRDVELFGQLALASDSFARTRVAISDVNDARVPLFVSAVDFTPLLPAGELYSGTGIAVTPRYVYMTGQRVPNPGTNSVENGVSGTTRLFIGQYLKFPEDTAGVAPRVRILAPSAGATVAEEARLPIVVEANDDVAIVSVDILVNGQVVAVGTELSELLVPLGATSLTVGARATDAGDNVGVAPEVVVSVVPDTTPPEVRISAPTAGSTVAETATLPVTVFAADNVAVVSVELLVDGQVVQTLTSEPYEFTLTIPTGVSSLTLSARATDRKGQATLSQPVSITVTPDTTPPIVQITSPGGGSNVTEGETVIVKVDATDDVAVAAVELLVNGEVLQTLSSDPYEFAFTVPADVSTLTLGARARDRGGRIGTAADVIVMVIPDLPPTLDLTSPPAGTTAIERTRLMLTATATDNTEVTQVELLVNGQVVRTLTSAPYEMLFRVPVGVTSVTLGARATDTVQQTTTTEVIVTVIPDPGTTVTGQVRDANGTPIAGAQVTCFGVSGVTAADGSFSLTGVPTIQGDVHCGVSHTAGGVAVSGITRGPAPVRGGTTGVSALTLKPGPLYPEVLLPVGEAARLSIVADLNRDGIPDVVTANEDANDVSVVLGTGAGLFAPERRVAVDFGPRWVAVADLNGDIIPDLVTANAYSRNVSVLLGSGDGTFSPAQQFPAGGSPFSTLWDGPTSVAVGDLNGDTIPDLVTGNLLPGDLSILLGTGGGNFAPHQRVPVLLPLTIALADLSGDTRLDIVVQTMNQVGVLVGTGPGTFAPVQYFPVGNNTIGLTIADLNEDAHPDVVTANFDSEDISVLLGLAGGIFAAEQRLALGSPPNGVTAGDVNGDGHSDLLIPVSQPTYQGPMNELVVLLGWGDGTFQTEQRLPVETALSSVTASDMNGDTKLDLVGFGLMDQVVVILGNADGTFETKLRVPALTHTATTSLAVADMDQDGLLDLVTANSDEVNVTVGLGGGVLGSSQRYAAGGGETGGPVAVADLDGDSALDIVKTSAYREILTLLGDGTGVLQEPQSLTLTSHPKELVVRDVNHDTIPDLVTTAYIFPTDANDITVLLGTGNGTFQGEQHYAVGQGPAGRLAVAELNGDGHLDVVVTSEFTDTVSVVLGNGDGTFGAPHVLSAPDGPGAIVAVDVNTDGLLDLATVNQLARSLSLWLGSASGTFQAQPAITVGNNGKSLDAADINRDGHVDLVVGGDGIAIVLGRGDGTFLPEQRYGLSFGPVAVADLDNDGLLDLVTRKGGALLHR